MKITGGDISIGVITSGVIVGGIAHLLAGVRDKRARDNKDFNEAADIMEAILRKERSNPTPESRIDFSNFRRVLKGRELTSFDSCVEEYERAKKNTAVKFREEPDYIIAGSGSYQNITSIVEAIDKLLKFTVRK